jgi:N-acetylneuraminic acid mutarotase
MDFFLEIHTQSNPEDTRDSKRKALIVLETPALPVLNLQHSLITWGTRGPTGLPSGRLPAHGGRSMKAATTVYGTGMLLLFTFLTLLSCNGNGSSDTPALIAPSLSNLRYSPTSVALNSGGGVAPITGTVDFVDAEGNLSTLTWTTFDAAGHQLSTQTVPLEGASGLAVGTGHATVQVSTTTPGDITFQVFATDTSGLQSNVLTGSFTVLGPPWATKSPMPTPRYDLVVGVVNEKIYAIGGTQFGNAQFRYLQTVEEYDPATDTWTTKSPMPTAKNGGAVAAVVDGKIYVIGGYPIFGPVQQYDPATDTWQIKSPGSGCAGGCVESAAASLDGKIYVFDGIVTGVASIDNTRFVNQYDPMTDTWTRKNDMPGSINLHRMAAGVVNGQIYVVGGQPISNERYDPISDTWTTLAAMPTAILGDCITGVVGDKVCAISYGQNQRYDPATDTWTTKSPMPTPRGQAAGAVVNGKIYVIGGYERSYTDVSNNKVEVYDPAQEP